MTDDEKQAILADVLERHREARSTLGCLRSKAKRLAEDMKIMSGILSDEIDYAFIGTKDDLLEVEAEDEFHQMERRSIKWVASADIEALLSQIAKTKADIQSLENQMREQGFQDYIPQ